MQTGRMLGAYRVLEKLGEGGMGEVYKAHDTRLDRIVAVKILAPEVATAERLQRFEQEARSASALNHPNILTIHDVGRDGDTAYFAMEWVDGQTLRDLIGSGRVPLRRVIQLSHQIAEGLAKAHAAGIVHRDLKPDNVMVSGDGFAKIVDFGIAKLAEGAASAGDPADATTRTRGTRPGLVLGSPGYMSPEQATGRDVDFRSDQFALGLLIYELATGTRPFERASTAQSLAAIIEAEPAPIDTLNPQVPPHLAAVVARCLAKDPADRYESTRDLARDLKSIEETSSRGAVAVPPPPPRGGRIAALAGTLAVLAAAVAGWWFWSPAPAVPAAPPSPLLAVRAFRSLSPDPAQAYFAAGMTEEIRGQLSQVSSLRLLSRNAVDAAPGVDGARIVRELGVTQLVDGSVRVEGNRVRISAELIDAATQQTLWSQQYDRELADILSVQSDVAMQIAHALRASLSPAEKQRIERPPTDNAAAYGMYLQAQPLPSFDRAKNLAAIDILRKAVAMDQRFAAARARIGYRLVIMGYYDDSSYIDKGIAEAQAALDTNPSLPMAHFTIATGYAMKGMDAQARLSFLKALELDPNHVSGMFNLSILEANFGHLDQSLAWARRGFALSGKQGNDFYHMAVPLVQLRGDEGQRWLAEAERRFPDFPRTQIMQALFDVYGGRIDQASKRASGLVTRFPGDEEAKFMRADVGFLAGSADLGPALDVLAPASATNTMIVAETIGLRLGYVAGLRGDTTRAAALLDQAERVARAKMDRGDRTPGLRIEMAAAAVLRHDHAAALEWMVKAFEAGYREYGLLEPDPILAKIEPAAKVREIVDRMRRDVEAQRARARAGNLLDIEPLLAPAR